MALDQLVGFDVETSGTLHEYALQPWRSPESWVTSYAVAREVTSCNFGVRSVLYPKPEHLRQLLRKFADKQATVVGWNTAFDVAWLVAMGLEAEVMQVRWLDAMLMLKHLRNSSSIKPSLGLKPAVAEFLPQHAGYEDDVDFHSTDPESLAKLRTYNERDALFTLRLTRAFWNRLSLDQRRLVLIEAAAIPLAAIANVRGLPCDVAEVTALDNKLKDAAEEYLRALRLHDSTVTEEVLASPQQLARLLYVRWGLQASRFTEKGAQSTDKVALYGLAASDVRVKLIRNYREAVGNRTKYTTGLLQSLAYNGGRITHPQARLFSTYTGRMTYSSLQQDVYPVGIALHQIPRRSEFRRMFVAPPGYLLLECDFSGQEFRWMAVLAQDPLMLQLCQPGEDAHGYMGAEISHDDYRTLVAAVHDGNQEAKRRRQLGKVANLSLQYRTSAPKLQQVAAVQHGLPITEREADHIWSTYRRTYRQVPRYWDNQIRVAKSQGFVETVGGRRVQLPNWTRETTWASESTAINFPVQGTGADQKYLALACVKPLLTSYHSYFAFDLHDGLFFFVPEANAMEAATKIATLLSHLPYKKAWGASLPVEFPVEAKLGATWGDLKEIQHA